MSQPGAPLASEFSLCPGRQMWGHTAQIAPKYYENSPWKLSSFFFSIRSWESQEQSPRVRIPSKWSKLGFAGGDVHCLGQLFKRGRFLKCLLKIRSWEKSSFLNDAGPLLLTSQQEGLSSHLGVQYERVQKWEGEDDHRTLAGSFPFKGTCRY